VSTRKPRLIYAASAVDDLLRLRDFIARNDPTAAARIGSELIKRIEALHTFPKLGKPVDMAPDPESVRDMVFGNYVVRYALKSGTVAVLRVWHGLEARK